MMATSLIAEGPCASLTTSQSIIYCNSIKRVDDLYDAMTQVRLQCPNSMVAWIRSSVRKPMKFQEWEDRILISSNVTARELIFSR